MAAAAGLGAVETEDAAVGADSGEEEVVSAVAAVGSATRALRKKSLVRFFSVDFEFSFAIWSQGSV